VITLDMPSYLPAMQHLKSRTIREKLYRAFATRASSGDQDNAPVIKRMLEIKNELAKTLGYKSIADQSLASKMAPSVDAVLSLTEMLRSKAMPAAQKEIQELQAYATSNGLPDKLELWDVPFWSERLREASYDFKEEDLRPYFPLPKVLEGMFALATRLFGVRIESADGEAPVWNADVRFFKVFDAATNEHVASFYLDPYSRPAEKRGGAWMDVCVGKSKVLDRKPVAYLVCNGSPPVGDKPSLMTWRETETLFHEFGHGLQHMLTRVEHGDAAGISNVEWDAVELPSQFMENWCYDKKTLYGFANHYETGEPLPLELFEKVKAAKNFQAGLQLLRQLFFGALDMELHSSNFDPSGPKTVFDLQHEMAKKYTVIPPLDVDRFLCSFGHIFAGGYSAGYYSYKWAEVMSADAFGAFEEAGLDDEAAVEATGRRFRETVLAMGGGKHPSDVYKAFRGRDPSPEALLRHCGLAQ
jgi:oligopeptidase A